MFIAGDAKIIRGDGLGDGIVKSQKKGGRNEKFKAFLKAVAQG